MFGVRLTLAIAAMAIAPALAGCSNTSVSNYLPDWLTPKPPAPPTQPLQFESQPPGADARTDQGLTCLTPCSLAVPIANQVVTFVLNGFVPQTVQVALTPSGDLAPNPVTVTLQPIGPPPKPVHKSHKRPPAKTAAKPPAPPAIMAPEPAQPQPQPSPFPPPPPPQQPH